MIELDGIEVKVGDRLWSTLEAWFTVTDVSNFIIGGDHCYHSVSMGWVDNGPRCLYWDEVKIIPPPRPKRMVKKILHGWVNVYPARYTRHNFHRTKELADAEQDFDRIACIEINQEYEVEE